MTAVLQITERGDPIKDVSERLGDSLHSPYAWKRKFANAATGETDKDVEIRLRAHNLEHSMSRRENRHDNAVAEGFFNLLKRERTRRRTYRTREEASRTYSITSRCSTTRSASMQGTECCHQSSSNDGRK